MVTDSDQSSEGTDEYTLFVVQRERGGGKFALCQLFATVDGDYKLPGTGQTVARLVESQGLPAAQISESDGYEMKSLAYDCQSGQNRLDDDDK
jgi:hypothetical protein